MLDATFGGDGTVRTNFTRLDDSAGDLAIQPDGKIVAVGVAGFGWGSLSTFALARYEADGSLASRSRAGAVIYDVEAVVRRAIRMAVDDRVAASDGSEPRSSTSAVVAAGSRRRSG